MHLSKNFQIEMQSGPTGRHEMTSQTNSCQDVTEQASEWDYDKGKRSHWVSLQISSPLYARN